ncbi:hypothetical protein [Streptomyces beigongshangae]|uniref:hypothetical protein n=1 Tax=Streptomyces beigongshangae TaxID=2841597 RepID=UPI001C852302|nr:hypothetical protein [Streptomyces sp. REN17]
MSEYGTRTPGENDGPVPRDLPDQQVQEGEDPWDVVTPPEPGRGDVPPGADSAEGSAEDGPESGAGAGVPDTDEAGTGRQGESHTSTVHPEDPEPEESSG